MMVTYPAWFGHAFGTESKQDHVSVVTAGVWLTYFAMEKRQFVVWVRYDLVIGASGKAKQDRKIVSLFDNKGVPPI